MHIRELFRGQYLIYGLSIVVARGAELAVMFFAAHYLAKAVYGELEYYKKVLELGGAFLSFGFPTLILTYTRSEKSKWYLLLFATFFIAGLSLLVLPFLWVMHYQELWGGILFYALFFTGGVVPVYFLVRKGSVAASIYKSLMALLFYSTVFVLVLYSDFPQYSFVKAAHYFLIPGFIILFFEWKSEHIDWRILFKYFRHFRLLIFGAVTLIFNNLSNMAFLYSDIFIIKLLSAKPNPQIADYSFSLNAANILMLIPMTLVQVDIEKLKKNIRYLSQLNRKILYLIILAILMMIPAYYLLTHKFYIRYAETLLLFLIIAGAKIFQGLTVAFGASMLIRKKYGVTLTINLGMIITNVVSSYLLYPYFRLTGIAIASALSLVLRYAILRYIYSSRLLKT